MFLRDVPGVVSAAELARTVDAIAEWQLPSGMIPWFPGGHADPWNHVEAAMALDLAGHRSKAERAYEWLARMQRAGRCLASVLPGRLRRAGQARRQRLRVRRDGRVASLPAHQRRRLRAEDVAGRRAGHRLRARPAASSRRDHLGSSRRRHAVVVRVAHRFVVDLSFAALRDRARRASRATSGPTGSCPPPAWPT